VKKKSHNLSILLLKPEIASAGEALKETESLQSCSVSIGGNTANLFHKQNPGRPPSWVMLFKPQVGTTLDGLRNSGTAAVLVVKHADRLFALTFGYGKYLLKSDCYEENFGLKVVLNTVDPEKLRSIDAQSLDAVPVHVRTQASVASSLSEFGLDIEQDLIYAATGQPKEIGLGRQITGKDAIKLSLAIDLSDLPPLLEKLLNQYSSIAYRENFAWIDHLSEVRDSSLIGKLDAELTSKIQANDLTRTWLSIPEIIDWTDVSGFRYQRPKRGTTQTDIDWPSYLEFVGDETPHSVETFKKQSVHCISQSAEQPIHNWTVYRCIYCELVHAGSTFALNAGKWYRVDANFLSNLDKRISTIPITALELPDYPDGPEGEYNENVYSSDSDYFALMDKKLIQYGGGKSKIEFCDLYTRDRHLIHVKKYGGSSVLSHLFAQGLVSTKLLLGDAEFRNRVNLKLPPSHKIENPDQKPEPSKFELVYAIASNHPEDFELPLFSKINLCNCHANLQLLGINVTLAIIPVQPPTASDAAASAHDFGITTAAEPDGLVQPS